MRFWKPDHSTCSECGVHFEPVTGYEARWGNLCATHRESVKKRDEKKGAVVAWATRNWERLSKIMEEETEKERAAFNERMQEHYAQAAVQMRQAQQANNCNPLHGPWSWW